MLHCPLCAFISSGPPGPSRPSDLSHRITEPCRPAPKVNRSLSSDWERILKVRLQLAMDRNCHCWGQGLKLWLKRFVWKESYKRFGEQSKALQSEEILPQLGDSWDKGGSDQGKGRTKIFFFYSLSVTKLASLWTCSFINLLTNNFISEWIVVPFSLQDWDYNMAACCCSADWW